MSDTAEALAHVPFTRKLWLVVVLTCLILTFPIAMIILATGDVYRWRDHAWRPIGNGARYTYAGLLGLWLAAAVVRFALLPNDPTQVTRATQTKSEIPPGGGIKADDYAAAPDNSPNRSVPANQAEPQQKSLDVEVATQDTQYGEGLILTAGEPFTLERIVFNDRSEEKNCDLPQYGLSAESTDTSNRGASMQSVYGTQLPKELKTGDQVIFYSGCGRVMKFDLYTDRGVFQFKPDR